MKTNLAANPRRCGLGARSAHLLLARYLPLFAALVSPLLFGCVIDRTGQSASTTLQEDLALTHTQVQALQRRMDDELSRTSARLVEAEETAQLSRRNLADSGALLTAMVTELQSLRGTFEEFSHQVQAGDERLERFQSDVDFRLEEFDKRLSAVEAAVAYLDLPAPPQQETTGESPDAEATPSPGAGDAISASETLARARKYFDAGDYRVTQAFLKEFQKRYPDDPNLEEALYLLGESYFRDGRLIDAIQAFQALIEHFPASDRIPGVMLRQGEALKSMGQLEDAKLFFSELIRAYPDSKAAATAKSHLEAMDHE